MKTDDDSNNTSNNLTLQSKKCMHVHYNSLQKLHKFSSQKTNKQKTTLKHTHNLKHTVQDEKYSFE